MKWKHPVLKKDLPDLSNQTTLHPGWILPVAAAPFLFSLTFWIFLAAIAAIGVISAVYLHSRRTQKPGVSSEEENRLWQELEAAHKGKAAPQSRELVSRLAAYREDQERTPASDVADDARNVTDLFRTLRRDQAKEPTHVQATEEEKMEAHLSVEPTPHLTRSFGADEHPAEVSSPYLSPPQAPGRMSISRPGPEDLTHWPTFPSSGLSTSLQQWPALAPRDEVQSPVPGAWPVALQELPFQIRMDITDRLEADLEWAEPSPRTGRVPPAIEKNRTAAETRRYERLRRQVDLAKELMLSGEPGLRKEGVELAVRLEEDLHAMRSRRTKRAHRK